MSIVPVDAALSQFKPDDYTVRLVDAIFKVVPGAPVLPPYRVMEDVCKALNNGHIDPLLLAKARQQAMQQDIQDVLWMARLLDTGDKGIAVFSGLSRAIGLVRGQGSNALETDTAQRNDAVLKAIGMAYMAYNAFPGSIAERVTAFRSNPAGQALLLYFGSIEVALPFADNLATSGGNFVQNMIGKDGAAQAQKLAAMAPGRSISEASGMLTQMTAGIQQVVDHAAKYTKPVTEAAKAHVPGALAAADKVAGAVATAADVMPVYTYLGTRLAAEGAFRRAQAMK